MSIGLRRRTVETGFANAVAAHFISETVPPDGVLGAPSPPYPWANFSRARRRGKIKDRVYRSDKVAFEIEQGTVEEWGLVNPTGGTHPFHVHVNAFQVKESY